MQGKPAKYCNFITKLKVTNFQVRSGLFLSSVVCHKLNKELVFLFPSFKLDHIFYLKVWPISLKGKLSYAWKNKVAFASLSYLNDKYCIQCSQGYRKSITIPKHRITAQHTDNLLTAVKSGVKWPFICLFDNCVKCNDMVQLWDFI